MGRVKVKQVYEMATIYILQVRTRAHNFIPNQNQNSRKFEHEPPRNIKHA